MARIIFAPICSECGQILNKAIAYEEKSYAKYDGIFESWRPELRIEPYCCPRCKSVFTHVVSAPDISRGVFFQTDELDNIIYDSLDYMKTPAPNDTEVDNDGSM